MSGWGRGRDSSALSKGFHGARPTPSSKKPFLLQQLAHGLHLYRVKQNALFFTHQLTCLCPFSLSCPVLLPESNIFRAAYLERKQSANLLQRLGNSMWLVFAFRKVISTLPKGMILSWWSFRPFHGSWRDVTVPLKSYYMVATNDARTYV